MPALQGIGVLVTRPEHQAMPLCRLLEAQGALTFRLPAIEIKPLDGSRTLMKRLGPLDQFDLIIFVSANAVRFGSALLDHRRELKLAAIGPATARALNQAGYRAAIQPEESYDSESLLAHPELAHPALGRILIIKGSHGRDLLQRELEQRGATVEIAEVYRRDPATPDVAALEAVEQQIAAQQLNVVTATSLEIAKSLFQLATPTLRSSFALLPWLVPSERVAGGARHLGVEATLIVADSAEDQDLVGALLRWRSKESGA
jgi:uroporphyrinogen-III synthase